MMAKYFDNDFYYNLKLTGLENKEKYKLKKRDYKNRKIVYTRSYTNQKQYRSCVRSELNYFANIKNQDDFIMPSKIHSHKGKPFCTCCSNVKQNKVFSHNF